MPESWIVQTREETRARHRRRTRPSRSIIRPAYTLGGTGGGVAYDPDELMEIGSRGLKLSLKSQVMIERCLLGWKEVEYEVMRDANDTCIQICSMENFDPMGVHTGDSIVVAPIQTLTDKEYPDAAVGIAQDHSGAQDRGRVQRPACDEPQRL